MMKPTVAGMKDPTARPRTIWMASSSVGSRVSGGRNDAMAKIVLDHSRKRRGPSSRLSQVAEAQTASWVAAKAVENQAPSSKPRDRPPRMSARPTEARRTLIEDTKAPTRTAATPSSGRWVTAGFAAGGAAGAADAIAAVTGPSLGY